MTNTWQSLQNEKYINLVTFRKNGQGVPTPVWFAEREGKLVVYTGADSGKVKRVRNNGRVELAACNAGGKVHGPMLEGNARIVSGEEARTAEQALNRKYLMKRLFNFMTLITRAQRAYIEIDPA